MITYPWYPIYLKVILVIILIVATLVASSVAAASDNHHSNNDGSNHHQSATHTYQERNAASTTSSSSNSGSGNRNKQINFSPHALYAQLNVNANGTLLAQQRQQQPPADPNKPLDIETLINAGVLIHHKQRCLLNANKPNHNVNRLDTSITSLDDETQLRRHNLTMETLPYLPDSTYWLNEYLHVGHVLYDIVLLELLALQKVDRIVIQRAVCHDSLCHGINTFESFFKGYFLIALEAFAPGVNSRTTIATSSNGELLPMLASHNKECSTSRRYNHTNCNKLLTNEDRIIPIYIRWVWQHHDIKPVLLSSRYIENEFVNDLTKNVRQRPFGTNIMIRSDTAAATVKKQSTRKGNAIIPQRLQLQPIQLYHRMCFEEVYRRKNTENHHYFYGAVSSQTIQRFKSTAYRLMNFYIEYSKNDVMVPQSYLKAYQLKASNLNGQRNRQQQQGQRNKKQQSIQYSSENTNSHQLVSLKGLKQFLPTNKQMPSTTSSLLPLIEILIAYRGPKASRYISNIYDLITLFERQFPFPSFIIHSLNTSNPMLTYQQQIVTIASCQIVITNHGAYESNLIYMQNSSLLIEIAGNYDHIEFHTFEQAAQMFGLYYGRVHIDGLTSHHDREGIMNENEMNLIVDMVKAYVNHRRSKSTVTLR